MQWIETWTLGTVFRIYLFLNPRTNLERKQNRTTRDSVDFLIETFFFDLLEPGSGFCWLGQVHLVLRFNFFV